jgi:photosystem II stability/assembly factor-like uncharacterized protein
MKTKRNILIFTAVFSMLFALTAYSQGLNEHSIKFETVQAATLVGHDGLIMRTENGGVSWNVQTSNVTNVLEGNDYTTYIDLSGNPQTVNIAVGENGVILKSVDNGNTWEIKQSNTLEHLMSVYVVNPNYIMICGANGTILVSNDYGDSWSALTSPVNSTLNDIMFVQHSEGSVSELKGFIAGDGGVILSTQDYGQTWMQISTGVTENLKSVYTYTDGYLCAAGNNGTMITSHDGGQSWSSVTTGITDNINDVKFVDNDVVIASCDNGIILRSGDKAETWTVIQTTSQSDLFSVNFGSSTFGISVGENSTELYTNDGGLTWENRETEKPVTVNSTNSNDVMLLQNYPNPFNPSTIISYELPFNATVSVKIYDMIGKEVRTLANGFQNAGRYNVTFNASNLSSGIYFYVLKANSGNAEVVKTMRMILTK